MRTFANIDGMAPSFPSWTILPILLAGSRIHPLQSLRSDLALLEILLHVVVKLHVDAMLVVSFDWAEQHEIEAYISEPFKQSGDLLTGYKVALDPSEWEKYKAEQAEAAVLEDIVDDVNQLDSENEEGGASARKRKTSTTGDTKKKTPPKGKKGGKKKQNVESEDDGEAGEDVGASKKGTSFPSTKKAKRDKEEHDEGDVANNPEAPKVREWRHKFQKTFLSNKGNPKEEDMPQMDKLFRAVEAYQSITIHCIMYLFVTQFLDIGQVVRHIAALTEEKIPKR
ncbi:uncharacterized protein ARMOST_19982 [Armillaria ostoyae]|uniref:Uncharacterized protein n=1 Tax=Armillaria ostoyae TaxID=47428 RepID=A0A284S621_ARMOS|nr:uncharacterized protein ARMOST_19982 [Armillaria ostoyae]